jgi:hypothetical protein
MKNMNLSDEELLAKESFSILLILILGSVILFSLLGIGKNQHGVSL